MQSNPNRKFRVELGWKLQDPTSVGQEKETFFIRVQKLLCSRNVLKLLRESPNRTISGSSWFELLQMLSSQTLGDLPVRTLGLERGRLAVPHQLENGTSAREDVGPRRWMDYEIPHRLGRRRVPTRALGSRRIVRSHIGWGGDECQWGHWVRDGLWDPTSIREETSASENTRFVRLWHWPRKRWIVRANHFLRVGGS